MFVQIFFYLCHVEGLLFQTTILDFYAFQFEFDSLFWHESVASGSAFDRADDIRKGVFTAEFIKFETSPADNASEAEEVSEAAGMEWALFAFLLERGAIILKAEQTMKKQKTEKYNK